MGRKRRKRRKASSEPVQSTAVQETTGKAPATSTSAPQVRSNKVLWIAIVLALATLVVYLPVFGNEFVNYDDDHYIVHNFNVRHGVSWDGVVYAFTSSHGANWFPLTWLSWMLDYEIYGMEPKGFHLTNLLFHVASAVLLFFVFFRMTRNAGPSAFVAAVFALHPTHVESVAWAAERKDVLSALFWILTLWAYARYVERRSVSRYVLVPVFLAFGLMAKPMLVTLPFALFLLDLWPLGRLQEAGRWRFGRSRILRLVLEKVPLFLLVVASSFVTFYVQRAAGAVQSAATFSLGTRVWNGLLSYVSYIYKAFWPAGLAVYYPHPGDSVSVGRAIVAGAVLVLVTVTVMLAVRCRPYLAVGWLWYLGTLVPVIGLIQVGQQAMADRYTYIPYIGLSIMLAWAAREMVDRFRIPRFIPVGSAVVVLLGLAGTAAAQVRVWRTSETLFEHALSVTRENPLANINLGVAYLNAERLEEAEHHLKEAIRINPGAAEAYSALGALYAKQQKPDEALAAYRTALRLDPASSGTHGALGRMLLESGDADQAVLQLREAINLEPDNVQALTNLGVALIRQGRHPEAIEMFERALSLEPEHAEAHNNWGVALANLGRHDDAVEHYRRAVAARPEYVEAHYSWGMTENGRGRFEEAAAHFERAAALAPEDAELRYRLGIALANSGKPGEAAEQFRRSLELEPRRSETHFSLGLAMTQLGQWNEAEAQFGEVLELEPDYAEAHYSLGIVLANRGDSRGAVDRYRRALAIQPGYAAAHNSWGVVLAGQGRIGEALVHFEKAVELEPGLADAHLNCGRALAQSGRLAEAETHFRSAVDLDSANADGHNNLGVFLLQREKVEEAVESFRRALRVQPNHPQAGQNLERALEILAARQSPS